ncbi:MAG: glycosyltransferase family 2 protein [Bacteroidales bacterium]|nr:glycosyltransferase family 2 protein [Bacteroidales bacterium]
MENLLSIIIPCYNEEKTLTRVLDSIRAVELPEGMEKEIVIVNDCSTDRTFEVLREHLEKTGDEGIRIYHQPVNMGKGAAIHRGIREVNGEYLIVQDADLEYDPREYKDLLKPCLEGFADVVYGSRFMGNNPHRILFYWHSIGNRFLTRLSNIFTNLNLSDMETCYKLFRSEVIKPLNLKEKRFGFEPEITAKISRIPDVRIYEVGISYYGRTYAEGKKINWKDAFRALWCILKYNVFSRR